MVRELCSRSTVPGKYAPSSIPKGFSTPSPMRIMALLGDGLGDSLHTNRGKIEISQVFMEIKGFKMFKFLVEIRGMSGVFCDRLSTINCLE